MHFVSTCFALLLTASCSSTLPSPSPSPTAPPNTPSAMTAPPATAPAPSPENPSVTAPSTFACTEIIGLTITAEWYGAGFEQLVDDARFQARTRPHTFVDQWADPAHEAWKDPLTSPCTTSSDAPDRVVLFAANWKLTTQQEWETVLERFVATAEQRYPKLRDLELSTVLRAPQNQTCGDPKSVVDPMIEAAIAKVAAAHPTLVHAAPKLEAKDCSVFEKGGPHFTEEGRKVVAQQLAAWLR